MYNDLQVFATIWLGIKLIKKPSLIKPICILVCTYMDMDVMIHQKMDSLKKLVDLIENLHVVKFMFQSPICLRKSVRSLVRVRENEPQIEMAFNKMDDNQFVFRMHG
jgi:hypothetical protein